MLPLLLFVVEEDDFCLIREADEALDGESMAKSDEDDDLPLKRDEKEKGEPAEEEVLGEDWLLRLVPVGRLALGLEASAFPTKRGRLC